MKPLLIFSMLVCSWAAGEKKNTTKFPDPDVQSAVFALSMVMVHDVVNPPAASRYYAYCTMGAYEIVSRNNSAIPALSALVKTYPRLTITAGKAAYDHRIAAQLCILETGRLMLPSGYMLEAQEDKLVRSLEAGHVPKGIIESSFATAREVASQIVAYAKTDHYNQLSAKVRYTPLQGEAYWFATPPTYTEAVEPNWKTIRPMVIDSCNQFIPVPPVAFGKDTSCAFYKLAREVYEVSRNPSGEQLKAASFWDCNPFAVTTSGHLSIGFKKMSPGGHWMNITGIVARKAKLDFDQSVMLHTIEALTLTDAFIACWEEKYRSNRVRPETFINRNIDIRWQPLLQTPPFPEYPSGHSVISTASAEILTYLLGNNFEFVDNSEEIFEIPARSFESFRQAAQEASISRLYGGIHFRDAIENGQEQGRRVGAYVVEKMKKAGIRPVR